MNGPPKAHQDGRGSKLASISLILGILSLVCGPFFGIPAVICGHVALSRAGGKNRKAIAGLVTGNIGTLLIGIVLLFPFLNMVRNRLSEIRCTSNLTEIGHAAKVWAATNRNTLPQNLCEMSNVLTYPLILLCPNDVQRPGVLPPWDPNNSTYQLVTPGMSLTNANTVVIVRCPIHGFELTGDGKVHQVWLTPADPNQPSKLTDRGNIHFF